MEDRKSIRLLGRDWIAWVRNDVPVTAQVIYLELVQLLEWVSLRDASGEEGHRLVIYHVGIKTAVLEACECSNEDAAWIGQHREQRASRVSEVVDQEKLPTAGRESASAQDVEGMAEISPPRCTCTQMWRREGGEVYRDDCFEYVLGVQQTNGIACDQPTQRVPDNADFPNSVPGLSELS